MAYHEFLRDLTALPMGCVPRTIGEQGVRRRRSSRGAGLMGDAGDTRRGFSNGLRRNARPARWILLVLLALGLAFSVRTLPVGRAIEGLEGRIAGLGTWGPV